MALKKTTEVKGVECNYHKIHSLSVDDTNNRFVVRMASYPSKEVREADIKNFQKLVSIPFKEIPEDIYNQVADLIYGLAVLPIMEEQDTNEVDENDKPITEEADINPFTGATKE